MKYILKKDLPFAKAGDIIAVNDESNIWTVRPISAEIDCPLCDIPEDAIDEWIEEVKPRELYVELFRHNLNPSDVATDRELLREDAKFTIIKVREVIE